MAGTRLIAHKAFQMAGNAIISFGLYTQERATEGKNVEGAGSAVSFFGGALAGYMFNAPPLISLGIMAIQSFADWLASLVDNLKE